LERLERLVDRSVGVAKVRVLGRIPVRDHEFPLYSFHVGPDDKTLPTLGLFGGVHGLEQVGTQLLLSFLEGFFEQWTWDADLKERFQHFRLVLFPLVNPGGMFLGRRSNPNGIDLMRNAPVEAVGKTPFILGGHRYTNRLPYFRGQENASMEVEAQALCDFVREELFQARAALALDVHSGFGAKDRLWYPYAKSNVEFPRIKEVHALTDLLDRSYPNHVYNVEAQSSSYTTHGDLWDYLFELHRAEHGERAPAFVPWTLEMGSWIWVKKNPAQLFSMLGPFNPIIEHRVRRTMRRHLPLIDFFLKATRNHAVWTE